MILDTSLVAAAILAVSIISSDSTACGQTLPEFARMNGGAAGSIIDIDAPLPSMQDVIRASDLVLRGQIAALRTMLNANQSGVETDYTIRPIEALKDERRQAVKTPGVVPPIVVRRSGGRFVSEGGLRLGTTINIFPEEECFSLGEEVVVMLTHGSGGEVYRFSRGEFGAFRVQEGLVIPMTKGVVRRRKDVPVAIDAFLTDLRRLLR